MTNSLIKDFVCRAEIFLPELFDGENKDWQQHEDEYESASFRLSTPMSVDGIIKIVATSNWQISLLYDFSPALGTDFGRKVAFYSDPTENHMFVLNVTADAAGLARVINVSVFDSIEIMYSEVQRQRRFINRQRGVMREAREERQLLIDFIP